MRYTAGTGLTNQQYCHVSAFALAAATGTELVLPPAAKRDSFGLYFSTKPEENQVSSANQIVSFTGYYVSAYDIGFTAVTEPGQTCCSGHWQQP